MEITRSLSRTVIMIIMFLATIIITIMIIIFIASIVTITMITITHLAKINLATTPSQPPRRTVTKKSISNGPRPSPPPVLISTYVIYMVIFKRQ